MCFLPILTLILARSRAMTAATLELTAAQDDVTEQPHKSYIKQAQSDNMKMNQRKESANRRFVVPETTTEQPLSPLGGAILSRSQRPTPATPADSTPKPPPQQQKKRHDVLPSATDNPQPPSIPDRKPSPYDDDKESEDAETTM
eukprot:CAMPEP_0178698130 /NCGR_PEP_ID=MMETSP0699-20121125/10365_1 /TAXON_ID=265572 /ORGANISM="Extubocellulus spinifer, Strain CCMP396" /LENGTH=143 /DNA_ID=CAMNT_0020344155 /DNA_START=205 /DNA_END=634 /DNA_ORIENTATION=+